MKRRSADAIQQQPHDHHEKVVYKDDMIYCHGTARRAVARAALHLGIECMTAESIDVLASCLLDYLERIGAMMATNAEASGRTSAHCNVYDAVNAIELCTCTAAAITTTSTTNSSTTTTTTHTLMNGGTSINGDETTTTIDSRSMDPFTKNMNLNHGTSWKDLATFCFGPNWNTDPVDTLQHPYMNQQVNGGMISNTDTGGKAGPTAAAMLLMNGSTTTPSGIETGWNAPYPDEILHFPVVMTQRQQQSSRGNVANPHLFLEPKLHHRNITIEESSSSSQWMRIKGNEVGEISNEDLNNIPDSVFKNHSVVWGDLTETKHTINSGEKRPLESTTTIPPDDKESKPPPTKKVRLMEGVSSLSTTTAAAKMSQQQQQQEQQEHLDTPMLLDTMLLPTFYPPIPKPPKVDHRIIVTDGKNLSSTTDSKKSLLLSKYNMGTRVAAVTSEEASNNNNNNERDYNDNFNNDPTRLLVRSALVGRNLVGNLGSLSSSNSRSTKISSSTMFWGSSWSANRMSNVDLVVAVGRPPSVTGTSATASSSTGITSSTSSSNTTALIAPSIVPIGRASGSRVSRILEGSMDPPIL